MRQQRVTENVEFELDGAAEPGHWRRGESTCRQVQRNVPPVILERRELQPRLADNLRPAVQRLVCREPVVQVQRRPCVIAVDQIFWCHLSSTCSNAAVMSISACVAAATPIHVRMTSAFADVTIGVATAGAATPDVMKTTWATRRPNAARQRIAMNTSLTPSKRNSSPTKGR